MKRILGLFMLVSMLAMPSMAFAAEQIGVYVAPKFVFGINQMNGMKERAVDGLTGESESFRIGNKTDEVYGGSIAIGYDFNKKFAVPLRAELEYAGFSSGSGKKKDSDDPDDYNEYKQKLGIQTVFVNAYWDINTGTKFTPYVGAGAGMAFINAKGTMRSHIVADDDFDTHSYGSKTATNFAWNVGAGIGYNITDNWTIDTGYRFVGLGSAKTKTLTNPDEGHTTRIKTNNLYQHQIAVGVRYTF